MSSRAENHGVSGGEDEEEEESSVFIFAICQFKYFTFFLLFCTPHLI